MNESKRCGNEGELDPSPASLVAEYAAVSPAMEVDSSKHELVYCYVCKQDFHADSYEALKAVAALHNLLHSSAVT